MKVRPQERGFQVNPPQIIWVLSLKCEVSLARGSHSQLLKTTEVSISNQYCFGSQPFWKEVSHARYREFCQSTFSLGNIVSSSGLTLHIKILDKYKIMDSLRRYQITLVLFVCPSYPFCIDCPPFTQWESPPKLFYFLLHIILLVSCYSPPKIPSPIVPLYFPEFCGYSILYTHIWKLVGRNHWWERTRDVCLSESEFYHSM